MVYKMATSNSLAAPNIELNEYDSWQKEASNDLLFLKDINGINSTIY